jgi:hypothetical protein
MWDVGRVDQVDDVVCDQAPAGCLLEVSASRSFWLTSARVLPMIERRDHRPSRSTL